MSIKIANSVVLDDLRRFTGIANISSMAIPIGQVIDLSLGNYFYYTLGNGSGNLVTFTNAPATGVAFSFVFELINYGGSYYSFPFSVKWAGGTAPSLISNYRHFYMFTTRDGGATWLGSAVMNFPI